MIDAHGEGARVHYADPPADVLDEASRQAVAHVIARLREVAHAGQDVLEGRVMKEIESAQVVERVRRCDGATARAVTSSAAECGGCACWRAKTPCPRAA